jgi:Domain of unknown function (DUF4357)
MTADGVFGRTIQLFLVDGSPSGLIIASIHGWTGAVLVSTQSTFGRLLARPEVNRTGIYILYGPDPEDALRMRAYIGEADSVRERIGDSAGKRGFWEMAVVVTTADEALTKGDVRYLEARLIEMSQSAGRVALDNTQTPEPDRRRLPEADRANMETFLANLKVVLPVLGLDLLKPRPQGAVRIGAKSPEASEATHGTETRFEILHRSGVKAIAVEGDGEFIVLAGSQALKDTEYAHNSYARLKDELISDGTLAERGDGLRYEFTRAFAFKSPSAAGSVILDRNTNGRTRWYVEGSKQTYHEWQESKVDVLGGRA